MGMKIICHPRVTHDRDGFVDGTVKEIDELLGGGSLRTIRKGHDKERSCRDLSGV